MCEIYVLRYSLCCGTEIISTYETMQGVISKLKMMNMNGSFTTEESVTITREEVLTDQEAEERYQRARAYMKSQGE